MSKIIIKKSQNADTRTCDWSKVSKEELLMESGQHIHDVQRGLDYLSYLLMKAGINHDYTKIENIDEFYRDFQTGFKKQDWWEKHQKEERHHFNTKKHIQEDVNLIDVLEQIVDGVMAGMARSGKYRHEPISDELLQKAYKNTAKLLLDNIEVKI
jgi:hypothetical protein